jgi:catechol 2,3-dioxygenase-like lactoylglutathione lyase family enzyme
MPVIGYDHVALPAGDPEAILAFYKKLGFGTIHEEEWRAGDYPLFAIQIGENAKLNFHGPALWQDTSFEAKGSSSKAPSTRPWN